MFDGVLAGANTPCHTSSTIPFAPTYYRRHYGSTCLLLPDLSRYRQTMRRGTVDDRNCSANAHIAIPAIRLLRSIARVKPHHATLGVCLQGDSTIRLNATLELYQRGKIRAIIVS